MIRVIGGHEETFESETIGACKCGQPVIRVNGSNYYMFVEGKIRYYYPDKTDHMYKIFRCEKCLEPIDETFRIEARTSTPTKQME